MTYSEFATIRIAELEAQCRGLQANLDEARDYAGNLLTTLAPELELMGSCAHILTQIDNWCADQRAKLAEAEEEKAKLLEVGTLLLAWHDVVRKQASLIPSPFGIDKAREALEAKI